MLLILSNWNSSVRFGKERRLEAFGYWAAALAEAPGAVKQGEEHPLPETLFHQTPMGQSAVMETSLM